MNLRQVLDKDIFIHSNSILPHISLMGLYVYKLCGQVHQVTTAYTLNKFTFDYSFKKTEAINN